jgi:hypothetical protein
MENIFHCIKAYPYRNLLANNKNNFFARSNITPSEGNKKHTLNEGVAMTSFKLFAINY